MLTCGNVKKCGQVLFDYITGRAKNFLTPLLAGIAVSACVTPGYVNENRSVSEMGDEDPSLEKVVYKIHNSFRKSPPNCIAVLPLDDNGKLQSEQREEVRRVFYAQLAPLKKRDIDLHEVDDAIAALPIEFQNDPAALGYALNCDSVLTGRITHYGSGFYGLYSNVTVGADVKLIRATNGDVLWEGRHVATSHGGSVPLTPVGLVTGVVSAAGNLNDEQYVRVTNDLARRLVSTIPDETAYLYSRVSKLKLRTGPGLAFPIIDEKTMQDKVEYIGPAENGDWVAVRHENGELAYVPAVQVTSDHKEIAGIGNAPDMASCLKHSADEGTAVLDSAC